MILKGQINIIKVQIKEELDILKNDVLTRLYTTPPDPAPQPARKQLDDAAPEVCGLAEEALGPALNELRIHTDQLRTHTAQLLVKAEEQATSQLASFVKL